jgi:hypothetical protein
MHSSVRAGVAAVMVWLWSSAASAQPAFSPVFSLGAAVAMNCLGYAEDGPMPPVCGGTRYANVGPYLRPYASVRPIDRVLVTVSAGYVKSPRVDSPLCCPLSGSFPRGVGIQHERTTWHGVLTGAYVPGRPSHPVRAFVGGGALVFDDTIRIESRPLPGATTTVSDRDTGGAGVFTTGALWNIGSHVEGRASYMLARRMTAATRPDISWRHEFGVGIAWRSGGLAASPNP